LTATCFGQGGGPLAVGMINDALKNDYGANAVQAGSLTPPGIPRGPATKPFWGTHETTLKQMGGRSGANKAAVKAPGGFT
jgi:hypothetical protein